MRLSHRIVVEQGDRSGGVADQMDDPQGDLPNSDGVPVDHSAVHQFGKVLGIRFMGNRGCPVCLRTSARAPVIGMGMSGDDGGQPVGTDQIQDALGLGRPHR